MTTLVRSRRLFLWMHHLIPEPFMQGVVQARFAECLTCQPMGIGIDVVKSHLGLHDGLGLLHAYLRLSRSRTEWPDVPKSSLQNWFARSHSARGTAPD
jgi:hypothetical protein